MWRDARTSLFSHAIYFLNICGRKREPGGKCEAKDGPGGLAESVSQGSADEGGWPLLPKLPMHLPDTLSEPSSAPTFCCSPSGWGTQE